MQQIHLVLSTLNLRSNEEGSLYAAIMELPDIKCLETNRIKIVQQTEETGTLQDEEERLWSVVDS